MVGVKRDPLRISLLILSGAVLYVLSFPKVSWSLLIWVAFIPWFKALEGQRGSGRFLLGWAAGVLSSLGLFYWVTHAMRRYGGLDGLTSFSILLLLVLYLGLYFAVFAWLWGLFPSRDPFSYLWTPAVWVGLEYGRAHLLTGFPWELVGHSQYRTLTLLQLSELTGVYGISFLILLVNQALYRIWAVRERSLAGWKQKWKALAVVSVWVFLVLLFGRQALKREGERDRRVPAVTVTIVQGNIDQAVKWNPAFQETTVEQYLRLTRTALPRHPELVVWPETAVPFYFLRDFKFTPKILQLARETGTHLLFGSPAVEDKPGEGPRFYNRAYLVDPAGTVSHYDKVHLVPFGEYVPLKKWLPFVGKMVEAVGDFSAGTGSVELRHPRGKLGVLICFETIFPELSRAWNREGVGLLINLTNDAWYGWTSAPYQHLSLLVFRAVENRLWVARAANTGFSAVIDTTGRIRKTLPLFQSGTLTYSVPLRGQKTVYARWGDWLIGWSALVVLAGLIRVGIKHKKKRGVLP